MNLNSNPYKSNNSIMINTTKIIKHSGLNSHHCDHQQQYHANHTHDHGSKMTSKLCLHQQIENFEHKQNQKRKINIRNLYLNNNENADYKLNQNSDKYKDNQKNILHKNIDQHSFKRQKYCENDGNVNSQKNPSKNHDFRRDHKTENEKKVKDIINNCRQNTPFSSSSPLEDPAEIICRSLQSSLIFSREKPKSLMKMSNLDIPKIDLKAISLKERPKSARSPDTFQCLSMRSVKNITESEAINYCNNLEKERKKRYIKSRSTSPLIKKCFTKHQDIRAIEIDISDLVAPKLKENKQIFRSAIISPMNNQINSNMKFEQSKTHHHPCKSFGIFSAKKFYEKIHCNPQQKELNLNRSNLKKLNYSSRDIGKFNEKTDRFDNKDFLYPKTTISGSISLLKKFNSRENPTLVTEFPIKKKPKIHKRADISHTLNESVPNYEEFKSLSVEKGCLGRNPSIDAQKLNFINFQRQWHYQ